ncbi:MAG: cupin domain-containing protein [Candidatus Nanopelagicales bacterium]
MPADDLGELIALTSAEVDERPWLPLGDDPGVTQKLLWQSGDVRLGLMRIAPGSINPVHTHAMAQHHILVTQGSATMVGRQLSAGSYVYVPPGVPHGVTHVGPEGVTFFYTFRPIAPAEPTSAEHGRHPAVSDAEAAVAF